LADVLADTSDLFSKQIQLAKSEVMANLRRGVRASVWTIAAGFLFLLTAILVLEAAVFGIASAGIAVHWAFLIVAAVLAAIGLGLMLYSRQLMRDALVPERSVRQINKDISVAKEQLG
jgi:uncharacterized membrane protein (GlpM family)